MKVFSEANSKDWTASVSSSLSGRADFLPLCRCLSPRPGIAGGGASQAHGTRPLGGSKLPGAGKDWLGGPALH